MACHLFSYSSHLFEYNLEFTNNSIFKKNSLVKIKIPEQLLKRTQSSSFLYVSLKSTPGSSQIGDLDTEIRSIPPPQCPSLNCDLILVLVHFEYYYLESPK